MSVTKICQAYNRCFFACSHIPIELHVYEHTLLDDTEVSCLGCCQGMMFFEISLHQFHHIPLYFLYNSFPFEHGIVPATAHTIVIQDNMVCFFRSERLSMVGDSLQPVAFWFGNLYRIVDPFPHVIVVMLWFRGYESG